jgi:putative ubiquitin-RnfH superfamily antitoxin RatB of RatAB toxin-antitoxin module
MAEELQIYVCYATPEHEWLLPLKVEPGTTIAQAIEQSGLLDEMTGIDLATQPVGIYGKKKTLDTVLRERDRVEIYRALLADPKDSRRKRAAKKEAAVADKP